MNEWEEDARGGFEDAIYKVLLQNYIKYGNCHPERRLSQAVAKLMTPRAITTYVYTHTYIFQIYVCIYLHICKYALEISGVVLNANNIS